MTTSWLPTNSYLQLVVGSSPSGSMGSVRDTNGVHDRLLEVRFAGAAVAGLEVVLPDSGHEAAEVGTWVRRTRGSTTQVDATCRIAACLASDGATTDRAAAARSAPAGARIRITVASVALVGAPGVRALVARHDEAGTRTEAATTDVRLRAGAGHASRCISEIESAVGGAEGRSRERASARAVAARAHSGTGIRITAGAVPLIVPAGEPAGSGIDDEAGPRGATGAASALAAWIGIADRTVSLIRTRRGRAAGLGQNGAERRYATGTVAAAGRAWIGITGRAVPLIGAAARGAGRFGENRTIRRDAASALRNSHARVGIAGRSVALVGSGGAVANRLSENRTRDTDGSRRLRQWIHTDLDCRSCHLPGRCRC